MFRRRDILRSGGAALIASTFARDAIAEALEQFSSRPQDLSTPLPELSTLLTPTRSFFVRSHFGPPSLNPRRKVRVTGLVKKQLELTVDDLRRFPETTVTAVLMCAGNGRALQKPRVPGVQWVHGAMGQAEWTGVRLGDVLKAAGIAPEGRYIQMRGGDLPPKPTTPAFIRSIPIERALDPTTLIAYRMNGEPLTLAHGAPMRMIVPGWAGDHWMKWLTELTVQAHEAKGFFMETAYRMPREPVEPGAAVPPEQMEPLTTLPVKSVIARPSDGGYRPAGPQEIVGVAFSGTAPLARVEISLDGGGSWKEATLEGVGGAGRWQVFRHRFDAKPGPQQAMVRATDAQGRTQPPTAAWNPSGYFWNAWHAVKWTVA